MKMCKESPVDIANGSKSDQSLVKEQLRSWTTRHTLSYIRLHIRQCAQLGRRFGCQVIFIDPVDGCLHAVP